MFSRTESLTLIPVREYRCAHRDARADDARDFQGEVRGPVRDQRLLATGCGELRPDRLMTPVGSIVISRCGPPTRTHAIGARSTIDEVRDRLRIMGGLPKIRTPGEKRAAVLAVERRSQPARWDGIGGQRDRGADDRARISAMRAAWWRSFPLPSAGDPPDRLWPHHTGHRTVASTPERSPSPSGDGFRCGGQNSSFLVDELCRVVGVIGVDQGRPPRVQQTSGCRSSCSTRQFKRCESGCCSTGITYGHAYRLAPHGDPYPG